MTGCPGLVVEQECEETGLDAEGAEYCAQFSQQLVLQADQASTPVRIGTVPVGCAISYSPSVAL